MKFGALNIQNFLAIGKADVNLADRGLVLIQGANEDNTSTISNGAGKSSVPDALCWVLYGITAREVSGDAVVNRTAKKDTFVQVRLIDENDIHYQVTRYRKHKTEKNALKLASIDMKAGTVTSLTLGTDKLTQERLDRILGCSYEVFRAAVYAGQEQMPNLPAMTDKVLKMLVEEAAGVTVLESAYEEARKRRDAKVASVGQAVARILSLENMLVTRNAEHAGAVARFATFNTERDYRLAELVGEARTAGAEAKLIGANIAALDLPGIVAQIAAADAQLAAVSAEHTKERTLLQVLSGADTIHTRAATMRMSLAKQRDDADAHAEAIVGKLGCPCDECQQPLSAEAILPAQTAAAARFQKAQAAFVKADTDLQAAAAARAAALAAVNAHRASMTDVSAVSAHRASLAAQQGHIQGMEAAKQRAIDLARSKVEQHRALSAAVNPHFVTVDQLTIHIANLMQEIGEAKEGLKDLQSDSAIAESVVKVFAPAGVRGDILDDVTPFLNDRTARYLSALSDGNTTAAWSTLVRNAKGDLKEKFTIEVTDSTGGDSFAGLSGGEKRKVRIAAALALQDLVARRASKPLDLFIGDEIDDALDSAGLERLTEILKEKATERGSVFVISHNDLKDWISNTITVTKKGGQSVLVEEIVA